MFDYKRNVEDAEAMYTMILQGADNSIVDELANIIENTKDKVKFLEMIDEGYTDKEIIAMMKATKRILGKMTDEEFYWLFQKDKKNAIQRLTLNKVTNNHVKLIEQHGISAQLFYNVYMFMKFEQYVKTEHIIDECIKMFTI